MNATLSKTIDAKKAKSGDEIEAKVLQDVRSAGRVVIPKGSKLVGHVTEAQPRTKEQKHSELAVIFDRAVLKGGQTIPLHGYVVALAAAPQASTADEAMDGMQPGADVSGGMSGPPTGGPPSGRGMGGAAKTAGTAAGGVGANAGAAGIGTIGAAGNTVGAATNNGAGTGLSGSAANIQGLPGLQINPQLNATRGTVIQSDSRTVRLDSGTQLVVRVISQ